MARGRRTGKMRLSRKGGLRTKALKRTNASVECAKNNHGSCDQLVWSCRCDCHPPLPDPAAAMPPSDPELGRQMLDRWRERGGA